MPDTMQPACGAGAWRSFLVPSAGNYVRVD